MVKNFWRRLGLRQLRFSAKGGVREAIERLGHTPLPPYIERADDEADRADYQTIFARESGAVAAPSASLHFTPEVVATMKERGVELCELCLGAGRRAAASRSLEISPGLQQRGLAFRRQAHRRARQRGCV